MKCLILFSLIFLTACTPGQPDQVVSNKATEFKIIGINKPKHFSVDLQDVATGEVYPNQYVSKHCNHWQNLNLGSIWTFRKVRYYRESRGEYTVIEGVRHNLCEQIRSLTPEQKRQKTEQSKARSEFTKELLNQGLPF